MNTEQLKKIIIDQRVEIDNKIEKGNFIDRDFDLNKIKKYLSAPNIVIISGVRRCGKSTFAVLAMQGQNFAHMNFDDNELDGFTKGDFPKLLDAFYELYGEDLEYILLDEIQNISGWELFAAKLRRSKKVIITGSNANLLSTELATHLTGRHSDVVLLPFSFKEFLRLKNIQWSDTDLYNSRKIANLNKILDEYIAVGGFPEAYTIDADVVDGIYNDIISKDILFRHNVRYQKALKAIAHYLLSNFGQEFSYKKLTNIFEIKNEHTMRNYVGYLEEVFLFSILNRFSFKLKHQHKTPKKIYAIDTGIIHSVAFSTSPDKGRILENLVYLELQRRNLYHKKNQEIYVWKDYKDREVDFVIKQGDTITQLVQAAYSIESDKTRERETKALLQASKELKCNNLVIVTRRDEDELEIDGKKISVIPVLKWLLKYVT